MINKHSLLSMCPNLLCIQLLQYHFRLNMENQIFNFPLFILSSSSSHSVMPDSLLPHGLYSSWNSPGQNTGVPSCRGSSQLRDWTQVFCIAGGFFTSWATREAKNPGVGSLSLLQYAVLTQESNCGLLHCSQIFYQLSYQGSPILKGL